MTPRRKPAQRSGAQIVAVRESAGNDNRVITRKIGLAMPDEIHRLAHVFRNHVISIVIAVRTRKDNDPKLQLSISTRKSSMIGLDSTSRAMRSTAARDCASSCEPSTAISKYFP